MKHDILITSINQGNFEVTYKVNGKRIKERVATSMIISYDIYHFKTKMVYLVTPKHKQI